MSFDVPARTAVTKEDDYRRNAAESIELANRAVAIQDKGRQLRLAENWLDLADRAHRLSRARPRSAGREHPLLREKLGRDPRPVE